MLHPLPPQQQSFQSHLTPHQLEGLAIFLVTSGDAGSRIIFRYPYPSFHLDTSARKGGLSRLRRQPPRFGSADPIAQPASQATGRESEVHSVGPFDNTDCLLTESSLVYFSDEVLANLFAVNRDLCNDKFEMKIDNVRFIGHPVLMDNVQSSLCPILTSTTNEGLTTSASTERCPLALLHVVLAVSTNAHYSVVQCYHELAKLITNAIRDEERKCGYLTQQVHIMIDMYDECLRQLKTAAKDNKVDDNSVNITDLHHGRHLDQGGSSKLGTPSPGANSSRHSYDEDERPAFPMDDSVELKVDAELLLKSDGGHNVELGDARSPPAISTADELSSKNVSSTSESSSATASSYTSPYDAVLAHSALARDLKKYLTDVNSTGLTEIHINDWSEATYCLPQKVHKQINSSLFVMPSAIYACLCNLRPYHCLLLLEDPLKILSSFPHLDSVSDCYRKVIRHASPIKNFKQLATDCDTAKQMIFRVAAQLIYWGKATIIFPLCRRNKYCISPYIPNPVSDELRDKFGATFLVDSSHSLRPDVNNHAPDCNGLNSTHTAAWHLDHYLALFNAPVEIGQCFQQLGYQEVALSHFSSTSSVETDQPSLRLVKIIVWCLQHHILMQLHVYVNLAFAHKVGCRLPDPIEAKRKKCSQKISRFPERKWSTERDGDSTDSRLSPDQSLASVPDDCDSGFVCPDGTCLVTLCDEGYFESHATHLDGKLSSCPGLAELILRIFTADEAEDIAACFDVPLSDLDTISPEDKAVLCLFVRLAPYFCGRYHLEEIMYHENVSRSQIGRVLERMHPILLTFESEDVAVTMYFKQSIT